MSHIVSSSPSIPQPQAGHALQVHCLSLSDLGPRELAEWRCLEQRALEPNPNLSSHFVAAMLRHLDPGGRTRLVVVRSSAAAGGRWLALVPMRADAGSRFMPVPHYRIELSKHVFLSGLLVDAGAARQALEVLYAWWIQRLPHGVVFRGCRTDGPVDALLSGLSEEQGLLRVEVDAFDRAGMVPAEMGEADLQQRLPSRAKKRRSHLKKLAALGDVQFRVRRGREIDEAVVQRHMALEHMGWKGENGSSLLSHPEEAAFFREMALGFAAQDRALFVELWLGERILASSSNFLSGRAAAAFKIGYDPAYAAYAPGINCELELMCRAPELLAGVDHVDSGTVAGSYVEALWPRRHRVATVTYATSALGQVALGATHCVRAAKRHLWTQRPGADDRIGDAVVEVP